MDDRLRHLLISLADRYETAAFLNHDPSWFMHQMTDTRDQETAAFLAMCLSYGSRRQFLPKIAQLLRMADGKPFDWIAGGGYKKDIYPTPQCFYRLYSCDDIYRLLTAIHELFQQYGSLRSMAKDAATHASAECTDVDSVLVAFSTFFRERGIKGLVPAPYTSACKRPCMFLDTHVMQTAARLKIADLKTAGWKAVSLLTTQMSDVFPGDPARADYALYGYDVAQKTNP